MAVGQQRPTEPSIIRQAVEQWPEGQEVIPFMPDFISPPFKVTGGVVGIGSTDTDAEAYQQIPGVLDLKAVRGDAFEVPLFFAQVCWTAAEPTVTEKPDPLLPVPWEQHFWHAQVRNTSIAPRDPCWYYYNWIPAFGLLPTLEDYFKASLVLEFDCSSVWTNQSGVYGTVVTMEATSEEMLVAPGSYRWDIQSSTEKVLDTEGNLDHYEGVRTWLQGAFTVLADYTILPAKVN